MCSRLGGVPPRPRQVVFAHEPVLLLWGNSRWPAGGWSGDEGVFTAILGSAWGGAGAEGGSGKRELRGETEGPLGAGSEQKRMLFSLQVGAVLPAEWAGRERSRLGDGSQTLPLG